MDEQSVVARVYASLRSDFDAGMALEQLSSACEGELYIFGGTIRDTVLGRGRSGDLDIMVPNGDRRAFVELDRLALPFTMNSQDHRRYRWNRLQIDIFEPKDFFDGFPDVEKAVAYFDLRMNALAVHVASERLINPVDGLRYLTDLNPGINWSRWTDAKPKDLLILMIRLTRLLHDIPGISIPDADAERIQAEFIPRIEHVDWQNVQDRFPLGRERFLKLFNYMLARTR